MATYELKYTATEIDELLESVDEKTIYSDASTQEHGLMSATDKAKIDSLPTSQQIDNSLSEKVDKEEGKGLSENDYTDAEKALVASAYQKPQNGIPSSDLDSSVRASLGKADTALQYYIESDPTVPKWAKEKEKPSYNYSEIGNTPDLSGFITKSVNDLTNYYLKSETYTKTEVSNLISAIQQFHYEIYATLPQSGESNVLYLIGPTGSGSDRYEEYVYSNNTFTKIGDTSIDLSGYVTTGALNTALANYATTQDLEDLKVFWVEPRVTTFAEIQDAINAGETVMLKDENDYVYVLSSIYNSSAITFTAASGEEEFLKSYVIYDDDSWEYLTTEHIESKNNKVTSISSSNVHEQYPSARAVYQALQSYTPTSQLAPVATSGDYDDLTNKPTIPTVPTNVSAFTNDAGYLTSHQDISGKADKATTLSGYGITDAKIENGVITLGSNTITPLTSHQSLTDYVQKSQTAGLLKNDGTVDQTQYGTYSKPSNGIPASDLASGVIPTIPVQDVTVGGTSVLSNGVAAVPSIPDISGKADKTLVASSMPIGGFLPNVVYNLGVLSGNTTFSMAAATDNTIANIWCWTFTTPSTAPTITWPAAITGWSGGSTPTINASKSYEVTVMNGFATIIES